MFARGKKRLGYELAATLTVLAAVTSPCCGPVSVPGKCVLDDLDESSWKDRSFNKRITFSEPAEAPQLRQAAKGGQGVFSSALDKTLKELLEDLAKQ